LTIKWDIEERMATIDKWLDEYGEKTYEICIATIKDEREQDIMGDLLIKRANQKCNEIFKRFHGR
jgi:hypothetical protein